MESTNDIENGLSLAIGGRGNNKKSNQTLNNTTCTASNAKRDRKRFGFRSKKRKTNNQLNKLQVTERAVLSPATISDYISPKETKPIVILRFAVIITWLFAAVGVSYVVYATTVENQFSRFQNHFRVDAEKVVESFHRTIDKRLAAANTLATAITTYARYSNSTFPFVTMPDFVVAGNNARILADAVLINWMPLVTDETREEWEEYAMEHRYQADSEFALGSQLRKEEDIRLGLSQQHDRNLSQLETNAVQGQHQPNTTTSNMQGNGLPPGIDPNFMLFDGTNYHPRIWSIETNTIVPDGSGMYLPVWQMSPATVLKQTFLNADMSQSQAFSGLLPYLAENEPRGALLQRAVIPDPGLTKQTGDPILSSSQFRHSIDDFQNSPNTQMTYPVFDGFGEGAKFVGFLSTILSWRFSLTDILHTENAAGLICVVENSFGQVFSYRLDGPDVTFLGEGDPLTNNTNNFIFEDMMKTHLPENKHMRPTEQRLSYTTLPLDEEYSQYRLRVYPTQDTYATYQTNEPVIASCIVAAIFGLAAIVFLMYDFYVQKRQKVMMTKGIEQAQRAAEAERELNEYLAHEVRNPLSAAISACSFVSSAVNEAKPLEDDESRQSVREDVGIISSSLKFINDLLRNMLDLHRAVNQQVRVDKKRVDLYHDVLESAASMLYCRDDNFEVIVDCPEDLFVETDSLRLKQVILNLGRNAAKFVEKGFVRFRAEVVPTTEDVDSGSSSSSSSSSPSLSVRIYVEDSGPGIPIEKRKSLFNKFQQSLDLLSQGTGIGLSLCKHLVGILGGDLWLDESYDSGEEGRPGSRFVLDLRTGPSIVVEDDTTTEDDSAAMSKPKKYTDVSDVESTSIDDEDMKSIGHLSQSLRVTIEAGVRHSGHPTVAKETEHTVEEINLNDQDQNGMWIPEDLSVLFVDDDMVLRKLFSRSIKKAFPSWRVQEASSGETAIRLVDKESFDLIFMDQYMASTEKQLLGTETVRELRAKGVKSKICGLSANNAEKAFLSAGADGFIMKPMPVKKGELEATLSQTLFYEKGSKQ